MNLPIILTETINKSLRRVDEAVEGGKGKYRFTGPCAFFGEKNDNGRIYTLEDYQKQMDNLQEEIKAGALLGELEHSDDYNVNMHNASHKITELYYDEERECAMITIELLETRVGKDVMAMVDADVPLYISSRASGYIDEGSSEVELEEVYTYDIVYRPGFRNAKLEQVHESKGKVSSVRLYENTNKSKRYDNLITKDQLSKELGLFGEQLKEHLNSFKTQLANLREGKAGMPDISLNAGRNSLSNSKGKKKQMVNEAMDTNIIKKMVNTNWDDNTITQAWNELLSDEDPPDMDTAKKALIEFFTTKADKSEVEAWFGDGVYENSSVNDKRFDIVVEHVEKLTQVVNIHSNYVNKLSEKHNKLSEHYIALLERYEGSVKLVEALKRSNDAIVERSNEQDTDIAKILEKVEITGGENINKDIDGTEDDKDKPAEVKADPDADLDNDAEQKVTESKVIERPDVGTKFTFKTPHDQYKEYNGLKGEVTEIIDKPDDTHDEEVLPMYKVKLENGKTIEVWPDEITESVEITGGENINKDVDGTEDDKDKPAKVDADPNAELDNKAEQEVLEKIMEKLTDAEQSVVGDFMKFWRGSGKSKKEAYDEFIKSNDVSDAVKAKLNDIVESVEITGGEKINQDIDGTEDDKDKPAKVDADPNADLDNDIEQVVNENAMWDDKYNNWFVSYLKPEVESTGNPDGTTTFEVDGKTIATVSQTDLEKHVNNGTIPDELRPFSESVNENKRRKINKRKNNSHGLNVRPKRLTEKKGGLTSKFNSIMESVVKDETAKSKIRTKIKYPFSRLMKADTLEVFEALEDIKKDKVSKLVNENRITDTEDLAHLVYQIKEDRGFLHVLSQMPDNLKPVWESCPASVKNRVKNWASMKDLHSEEQISTFWEELNLGRFKKVSAEKVGTINESKDNFDDDSLGYSSSDIDRKLGL